VLPETLGGLRIDVSADTRTRLSVDAWPRAAKLARLDAQHPVVAGVVAPASAEEVCAVLAEASRLGQRVIPVGLRSGVCGGIVPDGDEIALDLSRLDTIEELDDRSLTVRCQAGVRGSDLEQFLGEQGLTLGHYPQSLDLSSVGGWIATRASGTASTRYGSIEDRLLGVRVALADGTLVETPPAPRSSVGPDLAQLFAGSEGALGVICAATLRVQPLPEARAFESWAFPSFTAGLDTIRCCLRDGLAPAVVRLYDPEEAMRFHDLHGQALLVLVHEGLSEIVETERRLVADRVSRFDGVCIGSEAALTWWDRRFDATHLFDYTDRPGGIADALEVATDWTRLPRLVERIEREIRPLCTTLHLHSSHAYPTGASLYAIVYLDASDDRAALALYDRVWETAMVICLQEGAAISHHHGIGRVRRPWVEEALGSSAPVMYAVRRALDPVGILRASHSRSRAG
jgi:alkyldihydroxyacetonephosphate synthase